MNINDLPSELLIRVFLKFSPAEWFTHLRLVCSAWQKTVESMCHTISKFSRSGLSNNEICLQSGQKFKLELSDLKLIDQYAFLTNLLRYCGDNLRHFSGEVDKYDVNPIHQTVIILAKYCKHLKSLTLYGSLNNAKRALSILANSLQHLETFSLSDDSFPGDLSSQLDLSSDDDESIETEEFESVGHFVQHVFITNVNLKTVELRFWYTNGPPIETLTHLSKLSIEKFVWISHKVYNADYIESLLLNVATCAEKLKYLSIFCQITQPLDLYCLQKFLDGLSRGKLENLSIGFQMMQVLKYVERDEENVLENGEIRLELLELNAEDQANNSYVERIDEAVWSEELLKGICHLDYLTHLTLYNTDFRSDDLQTSEKSILFKTIIQKLRFLRLESNYGIKNDFFRSCFDTTMPKLIELTIIDARLHCQTLMDIIDRFLPNLEKLKVSNVDELSFKNLIIGLHRRLHRCGENLGSSLNSNFCKQPLRCKLGTAQGFVHDEAKELSQLKFCGLEIVRAHSVILIHRVCESVN